MVILARLDRLLMWVMNVIVVVSSLVIVILILLLIYARVAGISVVGLLELATLSAIWLYMCGAIIATRNREHLVVDLIEQKISGRMTAAIHKIVVAILILVFSLFFLSLVNDMIAFSMKRPQTTPALSLPLAFGYSALVLGAAFSVVYATRDILLAIVQARSVLNRK